MNSTTFTETIIKTRSDNPKHPQAQVSAMAQSLDKALDRADPLSAQQIIDDHCRAVIGPATPREAARFKVILHSRRISHPSDRRAEYINALQSLYGISSGGENSRSSSELLKATK